MALDRIQTLIIPQGLVSAELAGLNILVENIGGFTSGYDVTLNQTANKMPSPNGRAITSVTRTENDVININGWVRCVFCNGTRNVASLAYLTLFKRVMEAQKYSTEALARIIMNDGIMTNMRLSNVNFRRDGNRPQETLIASTWEQVNTAGAIDSPAFDTGGVLA